VPTALLSVRSGCGQQSVVVLGARAAGEQVRRDSRVATGGLPGGVIEVGGGLSGGVAGFGQVPVGG